MSLVGAFVQVGMVALAALALFWSAYCTFVLARLAWQNRRRVANAPEES